MRRLACIMVVTSCVLASSASTALAHDGGSGRPSMFTYAWSGLTTGLGVGVASGYLATGPTYQSGEWKMVVTGLGVGALTGLGVGLTLALTDIGAAPATPGYIVLRDIGFGSGIGTIAGLIVGALIAVNGGELRDLAVGSAYGTLIGASAGLVFGIIEAALTDPPHQDQSDTSTSQVASANRFRVRFTVGATKDLRQQVVLTPGILGTF